MCTHKSCRFIAILLCSGLDEQIKLKKKHLEYGNINTKKYIQDTKTDHIILFTTHAEIRFPCNLRLLSIMQADVLKMYETEKQVYHEKYFGNS